MSSDCPSQTKGGKTSTNLIAPRTTEVVEPFIVVRGLFVTHIINQSVNSPLSRYLPFDESHIPLVLHLDRSGVNQAGYSKLLGKTRPEGMREGKQESRGPLSRSTSQY